MARTVKGVCEKGLDGNRLHRDAIKTDAYGNRFIACEDCGTCVVWTVHTGKVFIEEE